MDAAPKAVCIAIENYEAESGKVTRCRFTRLADLGFSVGDIHETGYQTKAEAEAGLRRAVERRERERAAAELRQAEEAMDKPGLPFSATGS